ncbi:MAG: CsgG/HfaB family protein [Candidatus Sericytochromatia bacterium]
MNINKKIKEIEYNIKKGYYQSSFQSISIVFEYILKELYKEAISNLNQDKKIRIIEAEKIIGAGRPVAHFGLGQLLGFYKKTGLLELLKNDVKLPIKMFKIESLEPIIDIRNDIVHRAFEPDKKSTNYAYNQLLCLINESMLIKNTNKTNVLIPIFTVITSLLILSYTFYKNYYNNLKIDENKLNTVIKGENLNKNIDKGKIVTNNVNKKVSNVDIKDKMLNNSSHKTIPVSNINFSKVNTNSNKKIDKLKDKIITSNKSNTTKGYNSVTYINKNSYLKKNNLTKEQNMNNLPQKLIYIDLKEQNKAINIKETSNIDLSNNKNIDINKDKIYISKKSNDLKTINDNYESKKINKANKELPIIQKIEQKNNLPRLAVLYFDNNSDDKKLDLLSKGLSQMIITDLKKVKNINIIEREQLNKVLSELNIQNSDKFDNETTQKIGKLLGVQYLLFGSFFELFNTFRIDAKIVKVETGEIINSEGLNGNKESFSKMQKELVVKIVENLNLEEPTINKQQIPWQDVLEYSEALELYDKGHKTEAKNKFKDILKNNPSFTQINELISKF